jgi:hypothetical protein
LELTGRQVYRRDPKFRLEIPVQSYVTSAYALQGVSHGKVRLSTT